MVWDKYPQSCRWCSSNFEKATEHRIFYCGPLCYLYQCRKNMLGIRVKKPGHLKRIEAYNQEISILEECRAGIFPEAM